MDNENKSFIRFSTDIHTGLSSNQVSDRIKQGLSNTDTSVKVKTIPKIIYENLFTLFNLINLILAGAILYVGSYKNLMFMGVVICNSLIGIIQEIRAKLAVDRLSFISDSNVIVIRDGKELSIKFEDIVLDDIVKYASGNQIAADCIVESGSCMVNESLLTGEPNLIAKKKGDLLLSGSYICGGKCTVKVEHVGKNNYTSKLLHGTKYVKSTNSEIMLFVNKIIKIISFAIIPIGILLFIHNTKVYNFNYNKSIITTSATLIGMIPEGLVLLTSTVMAVGVVRLSKKNVLIQDIYCIETLARVDTLCLDKTGTITEGDFEVFDIIPQPGFNKEQMSNILSMLSSVLNDNNQTFNAIKDKFSKGDNLTASEIIPFSSEKKWSGAYFREYGCYAMGAAEVMLNDKFKDIKQQIQNYSEYRVITLVKSELPFEHGNLPDTIQIVGIVLIKDRIRPNAEQTLKYFAEQGVDIKVISGDNPLTVSNIAKGVGVKNFENYIDMSKISDEKELKDVANKYTIFGRVTPNQKKQIVKALKENGHTVAMTGDGVNDVLALKEADCSIAIANGSEAARNISHLILLDSNFGSMPSVVYEGRRTINNIQRSASFFLVKTIYSVFLALVFLFIPVPFPFMPIQMTLISSLTIGIPSFILAMEANKDRISGNLFRNIINKSLPAASVIIIAILTCVALYPILGLSRKEYSTLCVIVAGYIGILFLKHISTPMNTLRKTLLLSVIILFILGITMFRGLFSLSIINFKLSIISLILIFAYFYIYRGILKIQNNIGDKSVFMD